MNRFTKRIGELKIKQFLNNSLLTVGFEKFYKFKFADLKTNKNVRLNTCYNSVNMS
jgi:hypothetical protein